MNQQELSSLYQQAKRWQLDNFRHRMPGDKQGVEFEINGRKYIAAIRRLTPQECARLQTVPDDYHFVTSDTQQYRCLGNGWTIEVIKHIFSFLPEERRQHLKVLSLFDGMSGGQIALRGMGIKPDLYLASEIDKHAIANTQHNFPDTIQLGSVTDINVHDLVEKYDVPDMLIGGSPCFPEGAYVLTRDGYKDIKDVRVGDEVLTHMNRYRKVLRTGCKTDLTYHLKTQGFLNTACTETHPFYVRKKRFVRYQQVNGKPSKHLVLGEPEWVGAYKLPKDYYICHNIEQQTSANPLNITEEEAWVIGRYIADGHTRKDVRYDRKSNGTKGHNGSRAWQLILSIGNDKVNEFLKHITSLHYSCYKHGESVHRVVFSSKRLVEIAESQCGVGSLNKHFGEMIMRLPNPLLEIVLKSYLAGDGCKIGCKYSITTVSKMLVLSIQRVVSKLYGKHICVSEHKPSEFRQLCGRVAHQHTQYIIRFSVNTLRYEKAKRIGDKIWFNVKSFSDIGVQQTVYNLEVDEDNSYTANNMVVHNCQSFSFSGKMKGMSTKSGEEIYTLDRYLQLKHEGFQFEGQSYLFWEYMRILTELRKYNPHIFFLLENVRMLEKWERCLSHAIGIRGVHINSALVSAQNRRRIYWSNIRTKSIPGENLFSDPSDPFSWPALITDIPQPEDRGLVINDIIQDSADGKFYLSDETVSKLMSRTDPKKLKDYLLEPQVSISELVEFMGTSDEYSSLTDEEKKEIATHAYEQEKKKLHEEM